MIYRDQSVLCPRCQVALNGVMAVGHRMQRCGKCDGAFVTAASLGAMYRALGVMDPEDLPVFRPVGGGRELACPSCHKPLVAVRFHGVLGEIQIDQCDQHGTWFDKGELAALLEVASAKNLSRSRYD